MVLRRLIPRLLRRAEGWPGGRIRILNNAVVSPGTKKVAPPCPETRAGEEEYDHSTRGQKLNKSICQRNKLFRSAAAWFLQWCET